MLLGDSAERYRETRKVEIPPRSRLWGEALTAKRLFEGCHPKALIGSKKQGEKEMGPQGLTAKQVTTGTLLR